MNFLDEQIPPKLEEVLEMAVARWCLNLFADWIEMLDPWLHLADEMKDFDVLVVPKSSKSWVGVQFEVTWKAYFLNAGKYE